MLMFSYNPTRGNEVMASGLVLCLSWAHYDGYQHTSHQATNIIAYLILVVKIGFRALCTSDLLMLQ